jgi:hypothetical protein
MSIEIHTLRYGDADWLRRCAPTLDAWAKRHRLPVRIWTDETAKEKGYPNAKFCEVDMLKAFLAGESEQMMYVDADIYVHPDAPLPEFDAGMHIRPHGRRVNNPFWLPWCLEHFNRGPIDGGCYRNAGVWVINRTSAQKLLSVIKEPYLEGIMEQNHFNWWIMEAEHRRGLTIHDLPPEWNAFPMEANPAWFFHLYGHNKMQRLGFFERKNLIPRPGRVKKIPQIITQGPMKRNVINQMARKSPQKAADASWPMFMDQFHLNLLKGLLSTHRPKKVMEIGSHKGVSTQVFLDALDEGLIQELVVVEPVITPELKERISKCKKRDKVRIETESSWEILEPVDFVLIDGHHGWPAYADVAQAIALKTPVIAMHDVASFSAGIESCHGSEGAWQVLKACGDYLCAEDSKKREGMWTERGFGWALLLTKVGACKNPETTPS